MAYDLALELELNLSECVMFGDMETDRQFANNVGFKQYLDIREIKSIEW